MKGIDGFHMDVISMIKDDHFPDGEKWDQTDVISVLMYAAWPSCHEYLKEMNQEVLSKYDLLTVESAPVSL